jgi:hypothetical protein
MISHHGDHTAFDGEQLEQFRNGCDRMRLRIDWFCRKFALGAMCGMISLHDQR